ncbi:hypothetical protein BgiBS90_024078, partial [Biomphalaria glabrata]
ESIMQVLLCATVFFAVAFTSLAAPPKGDNPRGKCVREASLNATTQRCHCIDGFKGDGDLCCTQQTSGLCILRDDPELKSARHMTAWINFPCTYSVAKVSSPVGNLACELEIFAAGNFIEYAQYNDHLGIRIKIGTEEKVLKLISTKVYDPQTRTYTDMGQGKSSQVFMANQEFNMGYDFFQKRWSISGCGGQIIFRSPVNSTVLQSYTPGICVIAPKNQIVGTVASGNICNLNVNYKNTPYNSIELKLLSVMVAGHKDISNVLRVDPEPIKDKCNDISLSFAKCRNAEKVDAIKTCGPILTRSPVKHCFAANNVNIVTTFKDCVQAYCDKDQEACRRLKESPAVDKCHFKAALCDRI